MRDSLTWDVWAGRVLLLPLFFGLLFSGRFDIERLVNAVGLEARWLIFACTLLVILAHPLRRVVFDYRSFGIFLLLVAFVFLHFISATANQLAGPDSYLYLGNLLLLSFLSFLTLIIFSVNTTAKVTSLGYWVLLLGVIYVGLVFYSFLFGQGRGDITIGGPNVMTRILFMSFSFFLFLSGRVAPLRLVFIPVSFSFLSAIVLMGSRAGIAAAVIALGLVILKEFINIHYLKKAFRAPSSKGPSRLILSLLFVTAGGSLAWSFVSPYFEQRFIGLVFNRFHWSGRDSIYTKIWTDIEESLWIDHDLLGPGFLNYSDYVNYPHNIFLEVMYNTGVFGLALLFVFICLSFIVFFRSKGRYAFIAIIPIYMLMVSFFSGDIYDFRYFFVFLLLSLLLGAEQEKVKRKSQWSSQDLVDTMT